MPDDNRRPPTDYDTGSSELHGSTGTTGDPPNHTERVYARVRAGGQAYAREEGRDHNPTVTGSDASFLGLTYEQAIEYAISHNRREIETAETPRSPIFAFTRVMHSYLKEGVASRAAWKDADAEIKKRGGWVRVFGIDREEAMTEFIRLWEGGIRYRIGREPLDLALQKAMTFPILWTERGKELESPRYDRFVNLCGWLQLSLAEDEPIVLPVRKVAEVLKAQTNTVSTWIKWAVQDGFLTRHKAHAFRSKGNGSRAAEYKVAEATLEGFRAHLEKQRKAGAKPPG